jgi:UDP-glucuronate 4-epimerase
VTLQASSSPAATAAQYYRNVASLLITGAAGFIGAHAAQALAQAGHQVIGLDNFNDYYDPALKRARVQTLLQPAGVPCHAIDLVDLAGLRRLIAEHRVDTVLNLAAQAGVRYSVEAPMAYVHSNLQGFGSVLEACRLEGVQHLLYASSSSVYGRRSDAPFRESDRTDRPASFYAATKQANEALAYATASIHQLPCTGLRFFTVYGPWGRPDMAYWTFAERMRRGEAIKLYDRGELLRDFTYVDDVVNALLRLVALGAPAADEDGVPARIYNLGHRHPVKVLEFVATLEAALGLKAEVEFAPMQPGDVPVTCADPSRLVAAIGALQHTPLDVGLSRFAQWFDPWMKAQGA